METEDQTPQDEGRVGAVKLKDQGGGRSVAIRDPRGGGRSVAIRDPRGGGMGVAMKPIKTVAGRRYNRKKRKQ